MPEGKSEILQGTLDLMVLKTLDAMGPMHGYGIARRIEQLSEDALLVNQGTIYLCLIRLVQKGWIDAEWGTSREQPESQVLFDFQAGRKQLAAETDNWERVSGVIGRLLRLATVGGTSCSRSLKRLRLAPRLLHDASDRSRLRSRSWTRT